MVWYASIAGIWCGKSDYVLATKLIVLSLKLLRALTYFSNRDRKNFGSEIGVVLRIVQNLYSSVWSWWKQEILRRFPPSCLNKLVLDILIWTECLNSLRDTCSMLPLPRLLGYVCFFVGYLCFSLSFLSFVDLPLNRMPYDHLLAFGNLWGTTGKGPGPMPVWSVIQRATGTVLQKGNWAFSISMKPQPCDDTQAGRVTLCQLLFLASGCTFFPSFTNNYRNLSRQPSCTTRVIHTRGFDESDQCSTNYWAAPQPSTVPRDCL